MKKTFTKNFILLAIALVFAACQNPSDPSIYMAPGTGLVSLTIGNVNTARTILPDPKLSDFAVIELGFTPSGGGVAETFDRTNANPSVSIGLAPGTYNLVVTAYADSGKTLAAAQGSASGIVVNAGAITPAAVTLQATFGGGNGTFSWNITSPTGVTSAAMIITPINGTTGLPETITITSGVTGSRPLTSGEYRVAFSLRDNLGRTAELMEILHVYRNLTSSFTHVFKADNFHFLRVRQVIFPGGQNTAAVTFNGLTNNDIYLMKVNMSPNNITDAGSTGRVLDLLPSFERSEERLPADAIDDELPRMGHPGADEFNRNPPPVLTREEPPRREAETILTPGMSKKWFWVETYHNASATALGINGWVQKEAVLLAQGQYCNIWVWANDADRITPGMANLTQADAKALAAKFDLIYPAQTNLLGFEYGGEPGQPSGGKDGDPRVQILAYHMLTSSGSSAGLAGFFWGKDFYSQSQLSTERTNEAEIFYIEEDAAKTMPDYIYSTLVHEFQHMIHFNQKTVKQGVSGSSETWYNEMLSLMTEDVMANLIGIPLTNSLNKLRVRVPTFLNYYDQIGITDWSRIDSSPNYAMAISFGAYLLRNYGGPELLGKLVTNNRRNIDSLNMALGEIYSGLTFQQVLARFGETLIFTEQTTDPGVVTYNKSVVQSITGVNGTYTYTAEAFNVWSTFGSSTPYILPVNQKSMRAYSMAVHQDSTWKSKTGSFTINLEKPGNPDVLLFLLVK